jgi:hypothetical protein
MEQATAVVAGVGDQPSLALRIAGPRQRLVSGPPPEHRGDRELARLQPTLQVLGQGDLGDPGTGRRPRATDNVDALAHQRLDRRQ